MSLFFVLESHGHKLAKPRWMDLKSSQLKSDIKSDKILQGVMSPLEVFQ